MVSSRFRKGMVFCKPAIDDDERDRYCIITGVSSGKDGKDPVISYYDALPIFDPDVGSRGIMCDDPRASYDRDKDNVPVRNCPPPLSSFYRPYGISENPGAYVRADGNFKTMREAEFDILECRITDSGVCVGDDVLYEFEHHLSPMHVNKEKSMSDDILRAREQKKSHVSIDDMLKDLMERTKDMSYDLSDSTQWKYNKDICSSKFF